MIRRRRGPKYDHRCMTGITIREDRATEQVVCSDTYYALRDVMLSRRTRTASRRRPVLRRAGDGSSAPSTAPRPFYVARLRPARRHDRVETPHQGVRDLRRSRQAMLRHGRTWTWSSPTEYRPGPGLQSRNPVAFTDRGRALGTRTPASSSQGSDLVAQPSTSASPRAEGDGTFEAPRTPSGSSNTRWASSSSLRMLRARAERDGFWWHRAARPASRPGSPASATRVGSTPVIGRHLAAASALTIYVTLQTPSPLARGLASCSRVCASPAPRLAPRRALLRRDHARRADLVLLFYIALVGARARRG
jgi:hypothetical protein